MDETKHVIVIKTAYFEVVVSHGYFDLLTYATSHSVIDRVLESDVGNIFVQDTQRLENGNVRILDVGIIHKIRAHVDPSRRCGQHGDERNLQKCAFPRSVQDVRVWKIDSKSSSCVLVTYVQSVFSIGKYVKLLHRSRILLLSSSSYRYTRNKVYKRRYSSLSLIDLRPYPQNHQAYPPPPPLSPIQTYQQWKEASCISTTAAAITNADI